MPFWLKTIGHLFPNGLVSVVAATSAA